MNRVDINRQWCKGCGYCIGACPQKALAFSDEVNCFGYRYPVAEQSLCIGCGQCYVVCPDYALTISTHTGEAET